MLSSLRVICSYGPLMTEVRRNSLGPGLSVGDTEAVWPVLLADWPDYVLDDLVNKIH
jgi:hypothetical protein